MAALRGERLGGLDVDDELELGRLLHRQRLGTFENVIDIRGRPPIQVQRRAGRTTSGHPPPRGIATHKLLGMRCLAASAMIAARFAPMPALGGRISPPLGCRAENRRWFHRSRTIAHVRHDRFRAQRGGGVRQRPRYILKWSGRMEQRHPFDRWCNLFEQLPMAGHGRLDAGGFPVTLPPGRARPRTSSSRLDRVGA